MKELEKIKRVPIALMLLILVIIAALFAYRKPNHLFKVKTANTLEELINKNNFIISYNNIYEPNKILIDTRNESEFEKAHLENAINISTPTILNKSNIAVFDRLKNENKTAVLYGNNPNEVTGPFMILYQLGYDNIKVLASENTSSDNNLLVKRVEIEKAENDVNAFIATSIEIANKNLTQKIVVKKPTSKTAKVIEVKKKKKKMPVQGGC